MAINWSRSGQKATSPLRIDERILHDLVGVNYLDERLHGIVEPLSDFYVEQRFFLIKN